MWDGLEKGRWDTKINRFFKNIFVYTTDSSQKCIQVFLQGVVRCYYPLFQDLSKFCKILTLSEDTMTNSEI